MECNMCPRKCGVDRASGKLGFCLSHEGFFVAKAMIHNWEEPCIGGKGGAGTVFFSGCNLHCVFCQNCEISRGDMGEMMTESQLEEVIFGLIGDGAECIEFVTPTHYTLQIAALLKKIKPRLKVPVVWNSGGYESVETLRQLEGLVDVYMPDFKYFDGEIAAAYSSARDYFDVAYKAVAEMLRQVGKPIFDESGKLLRGVLLRHLVLPGHRADSMEVLRRVADGFGVDSLILSLMSQYTPDFYAESGNCQYKNLCRRVTKFEYDSVMKVALERGFDGYFQSIDSAKRSYTPDFTAKS